MSSHHAQNSLTRYARSLEACHDQRNGTSSGGDSQHEIEQVIYRFIALMQKETRILKVFLYGSHAKGIAGKWSDIDVAVISNDFSDDLFEERIKLMKLASDVDERIEPSPFRPGDFNKNDPLVREIERSGVEIELEPVRQ